MALAVLAGAQLLGKFKVLRDLVPGAAQLERLEQRTESAVGSGSANQLLPLRTIHAENENVVSTAQFGNDPPYEFFAGCDHQQVCKPTHGFLDPLETLLAQL